MTVNLATCKRKFPDNLNGRPINETAREQDVRPLI